MSANYNEIIMQIKEQLKKGRNTIIAQLKHEHPDISENTIQEILHPHKYFFRVHTSKVEAKYHLL
jgi:hypothetical protein